MCVSFLRGEFQLHDESVYLIDDQNRPDVLQPRLTQHSLGLHTIHTRQNPIFMHAINMVEELHD